MTKNLVKVMAAVLVTIMIVAVLTSVSKAAWDDVGQFEGKGNDSGTIGTAQNIVAVIINVVQVVGVGVAIIMLIVLAIKYISAAPGDKADIKKHAVVYVVGAVVLFAASGILQIIKNFAQTNVTAGGGGTAAS